MSSRPTCAATTSLSDRATGGAHDADVLAQDIAGLIGHLGEGPAYLAGHDWGAVIAYQTAMRHPEMLRKLAILNVPHTERMLAGFRTLRQLRKSWYMFFFQIPRLPEYLLARDNFSFAKRSPAPTPPAPSATRIWSATRRRGRSPER